MTPFGLQEESLAVGWMIDLGVGVQLDWRGPPGAAEQGSAIHPGARWGWALLVEDGVEGPLSSRNSNETDSGREELRCDKEQVTHQSTPPTPPSCQPGCSDVNLRPLSARSSLPRMPGLLLMWWL